MQFQHDTCKQCGEVVPSDELTDGLCNWCFVEALERQQIDADNMAKEPKDDWSNHRSVFGRR